MNKDIDLSTLSINQLKDLSYKIGLEIEKRIEELQNFRLEVLRNTNEYEFDFEASQRRNMPFVASCYFSKGRLELKFKDIPNQRGDVNACVGKYTAHEGEILDIRDSDSRGYYIVYNGTLERICWCDDAVNICRIKQYLKGNMSLEALLEVCGIKEIDNSILDDLRDD